MFEFESWSTVFIRVLQVEAILLAQLLFAAAIGWLLKRRGEQDRQRDEDVSAPIGRMERRLRLPQGGSGKTPRTTTREPLALCTVCGRQH